MVARIPLVTGIFVCIKEAKEIVDIDLERSLRIP